MEPSNFSRGVYKVDIPELGEPIRGKVRDNWNLGDGRRVIVTTDRQAVNAVIVCTIPGKGEIANTLSAYWFEQTSDIVPNHFISLIQSNAMLAKQAKKSITC